jgi:hypothetical protein
MRCAIAVALGLVAGTANADVTVRFTTTPSGGQYAPRNVVVAWVETAGGQFIKTLGRWAGVRKTSLTAWQAKAGANDVDAISGATRDTHALQLQVKWNLRDRAGLVQPDGDYVIRFESSDANPGGARNQGSFTVTKGPTNGNQGTNLSNGGFTGVTIDFNNATQSCGDGYEDVGETCDPGLADSCPATCPPSTIECFAGVVVGNADACSAQCVQQQIMTCIDDDGCCPDACDGMDNDCAGSGGGGGGEDDGVESGCANVAHDAGWLGLILVGIGVVVFRRRR